MFFIVLKGNFIHVKNIIYQRWLYGVKSRLKEIRMREYLMSPGEFAKFLEVPIQTYSGWENEHSRPTIETALKIAEKLNKDIKEVWYLE